MAGKFAFWKFDGVNLSSALAAINLDASRLAGLNGFAFNAFESNLANFRGSA